MDGSMPEMDGVEATQKIQAFECAEDLNRLPIIALAVHVVGAQAELRRNAGMDDCVTKLVTIESLPAAQDDVKKQAAECA